MMMGRGHWAAIVRTNSSVNTCREGKGRKEGQWELNQAEPEGLSVCYHSEYAWMKYSMDVGSSKLTSFKQSMSESS